MCFVHRVVQSHPVIQRQMNSMSLLSGSFLHTNNSNFQAGAQHILSPGNVMPSLFSSQQQQQRIKFLFADKIVFLKHEVASLLRFCAFAFVPPKLESAFRRLLHFVGKSENRTEDDPADDNAAVLDHCADLWPGKCLSVNIGPTEGAALELHLHPKIRLQLI